MLVDEEAGEMVIDLSADIFDIEGEALALAFAQIVFTATDPSTDVRRVRFLVEGVPRSVFDGDGVETAGPVTRRDYVNFDPD